MNLTGMAALLSVSPSSYPRPTALRRSSTLWGLWVARSPPVTTEELLVAWERLVIPSASGELVGIRQPGLDLSTAVYLARDAAGRKHLLIRIPDGADGPAPGQTRGLGVRCEIGR